MKKQYHWFSGKVTYGDKLGRTLGFPTINLEDTTVMKNHKRGVYATWVKIGGTLYKGALYFGPKYISSEEKLVIEIFLFDFTGDLYDETIKFIPAAFIRPSVKVKNLEELASMINNDCKEIRSLLQYDHTPT